MKLAINILKFIMIPAVAIYPLYFNILGGLTFMIQSQQCLAAEQITSSVAMTMKIVGVIMFLSSVLFSAAMVLAICKFNIASIFLDVGAIVLCIFSAMAMKTMNDTYGMEMLTVRPLTNNVLMNHLPSLIPFFAIFIVGLVQNIINDHAMGPDWKEYKKLRAEHKRLIKEREVKQKKQQAEKSKKSKQNKIA